ncbi:MAG: T9SS C-terminal target domain-containing protein [Bacteroidetes bacterium]|nr:MAG: T9SS C-terminal target domain-containing protein [Bacteroidota bacterium]REK03436.1 MAG: T9SS C-terminal target domain-containing protein [Bacteroidota bacterium]REK34452.1 MAG: T9SS C-terminal target domain-containing protein [Bacteroidota bacterium]REK50430.1 MAG: T9SS C-terminal target domain-containing protein [Bacteroidota bacterium]
MKTKLLLFAFVLIHLQSFSTTFVVTNSNASGPGSLLDAINQANTNPGNDNIEFNIPGMPPHAIPAGTGGSILVTEGVTIDGSTQPDNGYTGSCPKIVLDGIGADPSISALIRLSAAGIKIYGLWFRNFNNPSSYLMMLESPQIEIGTAGKMNLFTGSVNSIYIGDDDAIISSNYFGTNCEGNAVVANSGTAINSWAVSNVVIENNLISGNDNGISMGLVSVASDQNKITGNKIGTDLSGTSILGNEVYGIAMINNTNLMLGGTSVGDGNLLSGNGRSGCLLIACSGSVYGNLVGTDITGNDTLPNDPLNTQYSTAFNINGYSGISSTLVIGGTGPGERNVFTGNDIAFNIADSSGTYSVINNVIGMTLNGTVSPWQNLGVQVYYDTMQVTFDSNHIYGKVTSVYLTECANVLAANNIIGKDLLGNDLSPNEGFRMGNVSSSTLENNEVHNCIYGIDLNGCNDNFIIGNLISNSTYPLELRSSSGVCRSNFMSRNRFLNNNGTVNLFNGSGIAANDDIMPPVILGSNADSTWGNALPFATVELARDSTFNAFPQGYDYSIPSLYADATGHWVYPFALSDPNRYTAMQTDLNNNSSGFSPRLTLGLVKNELKGLLIYPVPAIDFIKVENIRQSVFAFQIMTAEGSLVRSGKWSGQSLLVDLRDLSSGVYFLRLVQDENIDVVRFLKH